MFHGLTVSFISVYCNNTAGYVMLTEQMLQQLQSVSYVII